MEDSLNRAKLIAENEVIADQYPKYFVVWFLAESWGSSYKSSLERGCEAFYTLDGANSFISIWRSKGYTCQLFEGIPIVAVELT